MKRALLASVFVASIANACINDSDTLAFELRNVDALRRVQQETDSQKKAAAAQEIALKAIGGRFERYPPQYYEMRIARLRAKPALTALEYDDLAVAYERLGKTDEAISILLKSKPHRKTKDDAYRFHANYGTFLVHKWLVQKDRTNKKVLEQSISEIEEALRINPNSHFGREKVQLDLERHWFDGRPIVVKDGISQVVGLAGIVMMGLAYELPDAYLLMAGHYFGAENSLLDGLALSRAKELIAGQSKLVSQTIEKEALTWDLDTDVANAYKKLRDDGDAVHQARMAYMAERFDRGEHPDTNPEFWRQWQEPPVPVLNIIPDPSIEKYNRLSVIATVALVTTGIAVLGTVLWRLRARERKSGDS
ncbi:MAG TPA: hypothetical protein PKA27_00045 [Fimbriimonadaceae bacterium]|nr:hypothetical protein [Fimbriimonadaceae bacterium]